MFKYKKGLFISLLSTLTLLSSFVEATVPNAPGSYVGVTKLSSTSVRISTKDNSDNEDGFYVSVYDYETSNLVQRKQISDSNNSHIYTDFTGLVCDKLYLANVIAFNEDGNSSVSDTRNFNIHTTFSTTCPNNIDVPSAPGSYIGVTDINKSAVRVNFLDNADNEDGFLLFDGSGDINVTIPKNSTTAPSQTYVTLENLICNKTYNIKVLAFNNNGNSATSDLRSFNIHSTFKVPCNILKVGQTIVLSSSTNALGGLYWNVPHGDNWDIIETTRYPHHIIRNPRHKTIYYTPTSIGDKTLDACGVKYYEFEEDPSCDTYSFHVVNPDYTYRNNVVIDNITGLMWQNNDTEDIQKIYGTWSPYDLNTSGDTAITYCKNLSLDGYNDWRLPNIDEALSYTLMEGEHWATRNNNWVYLSDSQYITTFLRFIGRRYSSVFADEELLVKCVRDVN